MLFRRIKAHIENENWFAVLIDFLIVVLGVFIGMQVQQWYLEIERKNNEGQYLQRLHSEIEALIDSRLTYNRTRTDFSKNLKEAADILNNSSGNTLLSDAHCTAIVASPHTTVPPDDLPTISELLSSGQLDQILSTQIREAILLYTQDTHRARDLILAINNNSNDLARSFPSLIKARLMLNPDFPDGIWVNPVCDTQAMRSNDAFMNSFSISSYQYIVYANRGVLRLSSQLDALHETLDEALGIKHDETESKP